MVVYINVCGRGEGVGRVGRVLLCRCVSERKRDVWVCMGLISCIFKLCLI